MSDKLINSELRAVASESLAKEVEDELKVEDPSKEKAEAAIKEGEKHE